MFHGCGLGALSEIGDLLTVSGRGLTADVQDFCTEDLLKTFCDDDCICKSSLSLSVALNATVAGRTMVAASAVVASLGIVFGRNTR